MGINPLVASQWPTKVDRSITLPPITVAELPGWRETSILGAQKVDKENKKDSQGHFQKFLTKFAIAITSLLATGLSTPKIIKRTKNISDRFTKQFLRVCAPIAIAVGAAATLSTALQLILSGKVEKDYLMSDIKDALITSTIVRAYTSFTTESGRLLSTFRILERSKLTNRFLVNGMIGGTYALFRGIVRPDKADDLTMKNLANGLIEGIYLGEGARFVNKLGNKWITPQNAGLKGYKLAQLGTIVLGAALGSMLFNVSKYIAGVLFDKECYTNPTKQINKNDIIEHLFKGNSYPTLII